MKDSVTAHVPTAAFTSLAILGIALAELPAMANGHGVAAAFLVVAQNDTNNTPESVTLALPVSGGGLRLRGGSNRGDYNLQILDSPAEDAGEGVLLSCVAENGRDNGEAAFPGTNYGTSAVDYSRTGGNAGRFFIPVFNAPAGAEYNLNVAAAWFPYDRWLGGFARNSGETNGGANDLFTGSPGLVAGTHFVDLGGGRSRVDLTPLGIHSATDGVLLVTHGKNEDNFALSAANPTNGTWTVFVKDNGTDGAATEQDPVAFVFVPRTNDLVVSGKFAGTGAILLHSGATPRFTVTPAGTGRWRLTIPGQSPASGVLILSPEGGGTLNRDNIVSYEPDGDGWAIESRDLPGNPPPLEAVGAEPVASFVFIPLPVPTRVGPPDDGVVGAAPTLRVQVPPGLSGPSRVSFFGRVLPPAANTNADFTIVALPDTQFYSATMNGGTPAMFQAQTDWVVANRANLNIRFVTHLGDITQRGQNGGNNVEWRAATNALYRLENPATTLLASGIPYGLGVGNHDQTPIGGGNTADTTFFNQFFGVNHFLGYDYYGGHYGTNNNNSFQFFSAAGLDFIVIHLEYDTTPEAAVLAWADNLLQAHPHHRAIVTSHWIVNTGFNATFSAQGQAIYNALKGNPNLFLLLCGHIAGEGQRTDIFEGRTVYSILTDYQSRTNGGDGWLRYYTFSPSNNLIRAFTYSPWTGQFETDADSQFTLPYDMRLTGPAANPFIALATNLASTGAELSLPWPGLTNGVTAEWYVAVTDADGNTATSPVWRFRVANAPPAAPNQSRTVTGDTPNGLTLNASDPNGDALTFQLLTPPQQGRLVNWDAATGHVTYEPVFGFRGTDRFTFRVTDGQLFSAVATCNLTVTAPPDTNGNGLPDDWETFYGLTSPWSDEDGDGVPNVAEYRAHTNPTNAASALRLLGAGRDDFGHPTITWAAVGGVRYRVQIADASAAGLPVFTDVPRPLALELNPAPWGAITTQSFTDDGTLTGPPAPGGRLYRVRLVP